MRYNLRFSTSDSAPQYARELFHLFIIDLNSHTYDVENANESRPRHIYLFGNMHLAGLVERGHRRPCLILCSCEVHCAGSPQMGEPNCRGDICICGRHLFSVEPYHQSQTPPRSRPRSRPALDPEAIAVMSSQQSKAVSCGSICQAAAQCSTA